MSLSRAVYWINALGRNLVSMRGLTAFLSSFGALWLLVEIADYFSPAAARALKSAAVLFFLLGIAFAVWQCKPRSSFNCQLSGRDVKIEIKVGDIFRQTGSLVVGTNTTFDTRIGPHLIAEHSIQGQFTRRYFASDDDLSAAIESKLSGIEAVEIEGERAGKSREYPVGTTVQLRVKDRSGDRTAFLVAMARMNAHGTASTRTEDLKESLANLWVFVAERGTKGILVTPVLGSRFGRVSLPREEIVQEMIKSFVAACAENSFCEKLVIVLRGKDVVEHSIDLRALDDYLRHVCRYTKLDARSTPNFGTAVS